MSVPTVTPAELASRLNNSKRPTVVDVRTPAEFRELHLRGASNVPLDQLEPHKLPSRENDEPLYLICRTGNRAAQACRQLAARGVMNVVNVEGGTVACEAEGLPVVRGQAAMSLERQVRIAAGSLVVLSVALSFLHPAFLAVAAFVGAGLVFAGVTDTCGMAMLLARMPWNQAGALESANPNSPTAANAS